MGYKKGYKYSAQLYSGPKGLLKSRGGLELNVTTEERRSSFFQVKARGEAVASWDWECYAAHVLCYTFGGPRRGSNFSLTRGRFHPYFTK